MFITSDIHVGVARSAGTTPASAEALRQYLIDSLRWLLNATDQHHVVINGDLFDTYNIPLSDLLNTYQVFSDWLQAGHERYLTLIPGNHCLSKNSSNLSSFELMARLLQARFSGRVDYLVGGAWVNYAKGVYAISHVTNQAVFDMELAGVPDVAKFVLLHANYDNPFAGQQDHSLNVTREQAKAFADRGVTLIFGHEHQGRTAFGGKVFITGNPFPSSVSDCLAHGDGQLDGKKYAIELVDGEIRRIQTWSRDSAVAGYAEVDWRDLTQTEQVPKFVRVVGSAEADEAADVIKAISVFRQKTDAFVVTNAVKVAQLNDTDEIEVSAEDVRSVNVVDMLLETLTEEQAAVLRALMEKAE